MQTILFQAILCLSLFLGSAAAAGNKEPKETGRYLFYMPLASKSVAIMFMPVAETLAEKGHQIVILMPDEGVKAKSSNIKIVTFENPLNGMY